MNGLACFLVCDSYKRYRCEKNVAIKREGLILEKQKSLAVEANIEVNLTT